MHSPESDDDELFVVLDGDGRVHLAEEGEHDLDYDCAHWPHWLQVGLQHPRPTLQTLQEPIFAAALGLLSTGGFPNPCRARVQHTPILGCRCHQLAVH
jgi:hypothetical protein